MFTTIRFSFKLKDGARILTMTVKSWKTKEQAKAYLIRYCNIPWFAGGVIEDENGEVLYERTPTQSEYFYTPSSVLLEQLAEKYESQDVTPPVGGFFYPILTESFAASIYSS